MSEEFKERFETIEQAMKDIADSQAKSEWLHRQNQIGCDKRLEQIEKHLKHIT